MPDPYNPWAAPVFPQGAAFGTGSPQEDAQRQPNMLDNLLSHIAGALGRGFMAPGQALQSTEPVTTEQMIQPTMDVASMTPYAKAYQALARAHAVAAAAGGNKL